MALNLFMIGLMVRDMDKSLEFYRRVGVAVPDASEGKTHIEVKMGELTFFLDSRPTRWDARFAWDDAAARPAAADSYPTILEFYLQTQAAVEAKYAELTGYGYEGYRAPYDMGFGMCFAMIKDPDGNVLLLSGDIKKARTS